MEALIARLAALPELRAAAEEQARAYVDRRYHLFRSSPHWDVLPESLCREHIETHIARLLDPTNPAAEGVLADVYRALTGVPSAHLEPDDQHGDLWIVCACNETGTYEIEMPIGTSRRAPTRYEAWARALVAHYDLAARTANGSAG